MGLYIHTPELVATNTSAITNNMSTCRERVKTSPLMVERFDTPSETTNSQENAHKETLNHDIH
jgi:hypothetical protein